MQVVLLPCHGYIPLLFVGATFVSAWAGVKANAARKKYGVEYPQAYLEQTDKNAKAFNPVQHAHHNLVEHLPVYFALLLSSAVFRPQAAAIAGGIRLAGFVIVARGIATEKPKKRLHGAIGHIGTVAMLVLSVETGFRLLEVL